DAVVAAARAHVLDALVADVGAAVEAVPPDQAPGAYVRRMLGHLAERPNHARMIVEAVLHGEEPGGEERWKALAGPLGAAREARGLGPGPDVRTLAIATGGAIDAIIAERLRDAAYDAAAAAETVVTMLESALFA